MRRRAGWLLAVPPLLVLVVFFGIPLVGMLHRGLWPDGSVDVGGVADVLSRARVHRVLWFTLWSAAVATAITLVLGLPIAHVLYRLRFPGRQLLRSAVSVPFVLPTVVVGVAFRTLLSESGPLGFLDLDGTATAILAALVFFNVSVVVRGVGTAWAALDPRPGEAAATLGASPAQRFRTVTLPALLPSIVSSASVVFLFCATAFGVVLTLGGLRYSTVETEIYLLTTQFLDLRAAATLSVLQLLFVGVLLLLSSRARPVPASSRPAPQRRPARPDVPWLVVTVVVVAFLAAPVVSLVIRSLRPQGSWSLAGYRGLRHDVLQATANSVEVATIATVVAVVLALMVAAVVTRPTYGDGERRARAVLDGAFMVPLGVSAVTIGFGMLVTLDRPPLDFRDSLALVPIAQALVALPLVVRVIAPVLRGIDDRQRQVAASLGAGPFRSFTTVDLPLMARPLAAATGLAFAVCIGEFGATSFLVRPDRPTLPVMVFRLIGRPGPDSFATALAASVVLATVTVVVMALAEQFRGLGDSPYERVR